MRENDLSAVSEIAILANPFATKERYYKYLLDELRENPDLSFVAIENEKLVDQFKQTPKTARRCLRT